MHARQDQHVWGSRLECLVITVHICPSQPNCIHTQCRSTYVCIPVKHLLSGQSGWQISSSARQHWQFITKLVKPFAPSYDGCVSGSWHVVLLAPGGVTTTFIQSALLGTVGARRKAQGQPSAMWRALGCNLPHAEVRFPYTTPVSCCTSRGTHPAATADARGLFCNSQQATANTAIHQGCRNLKLMTSSLTATTNFLPLRA